MSDSDIIIEEGSISECKMLELVAKLGHDVTIHIGPARKKLPDLS